MNNVWLLCLLAGIFWAAAPLVGRLSNINAMTLAVVVTLGQLFVSFPVALGQNWTAASWRAIAFGLLAGLLNGIGVFAFYRLVAGWSEGLWDLSRVAPIVFVLVSVFTVFGARAFYGEALTTDKMIGLGFACLAIWFLK
jgi:drug/metabolite transporter (DMT)-like permease